MSPRDYTRYFTGCAFVLLALAWIFLSGSLSGCASDTWVRTVPNDRTAVLNPQGYAGLTKLYVHKIGDEITLEGTFGKEYDNLHAEGDLVAGTFIVDAGSVRAFEGQRTRAMVEAAYISVLAKWPDIAGKGIDFIRETVAGYVKTLGLASGAETAQVAAGVVGKIVQAKAAAQAGG